MVNKNIILNYLKDKNYNLEEDKVTGISFNLDNRDLLIRGSRLDLIELSDYLVSVALSEGNDHVHLDDLTILNKDSDIDELIIEKR